MSADSDVHPTAVALLDAVDAILMSEGASSLSLRQVEVVAGATHGSVRHHFGSLEGLLAAAFSRKNDEMVRRQTDMYQSEAPVLQKWRTGSREFFDTDLASGWSLRAFEANHLAINYPELRAALRPQFDAWMQLLADVTTSAVEEFGVDLTESQTRGVAMTVAYSQFGAMTEALQGGHPWHEDYLNAWDDLLVFLEQRRQTKEKSDDRDRPTDS